MTLADRMARMAYESAIRRDINPEWALRPALIQQLKAEVPSQFGPSEDGSECVAGIPIGDQVPESRLGVDLVPARRSKE